MIQFNLLPDVKLEYVKAKKTRRLIALSTFFLTGLAVFVFVMMFMVVNFFQKDNIKDLDKDTDKLISEINSVPDINKALTIQNQLKTLPGLHEAKPATDRITGYLVQLTPADAKITDVNVDFSTNSMTINGSVGSIETTNRFVDTLKFTNYKEGETTDKAFSDVVLSNYGIAKNNGRSNYGLTFKFNPIIFDNKKTVQLVVPDMITTRSITEKPTDLFEQKPEEQPQ